MIKIIIKDSESTSTIEPKEELCADQYIPYFFAAMVLEGFVPHSIYSGIAHWVEANEPIYEPKDDTVDKPE